MPTDPATPRSAPQGVGVEQVLIDHAASVVTRSGGSRSCLSWLFCCCPDDTLLAQDALPAEDVIPNWFDLGKNNQHSMLRDTACHLLFAADGLKALLDGLNGLPLGNPKARELAGQAGAALEALAPVKHRVLTDAAGISRSSIEQLVRCATRLSSALMKLDRLAKQPSTGGKPSALLGAALWQPTSVSPHRAEPGLGPEVVTALDRFRANLSLDIESLRQLQARIPA